jgi:hypothetical protein
MQIFSALWLAATVAQAHCKSTINSEIYLPMSRSRRQSGRQGLVRNPRIQEREHKARHRGKSFTPNLALLHFCTSHVLTIVTEPYRRRHPLLYFQTRGKRRHRTRWLNYPLHLHAASEPPRTDTILPGQSARRQRCEELGRQWSGVVQDQHDDAECECAEADELAGTEYAITFLFLPIALLHEPGKSGTDVC